MPKLTFIRTDGTRLEVEAPIGLSVLEIAHRNFPAPPPQGVEHAQLERPEVRGQARRLGAEVHWKEYSASRGSGIGGRGSGFGDRGVCVISSA